MYPCESFAKKGPQPLTFCAVCGVLASGKQCASRVPPPGCDPEGKDTKITQGNGERNGRETGRQGTRQQTSGERTLEPQHAEKSARRRRHSWPDCWPAQNRPAVAIMEPESAPPLKAIVHAGTFGDSWRSCTARPPRGVRRAAPSAAAGGPGAHTGSDRCHPDLDAHATPPRRSALPTHLARGHAEQRLELHREVVALGD